MRLPPFNPYIALIIGVIAVSTTAIFVKLAATVPVSIIAFYRLILTAIIMLPIIIVKYKTELRSVAKKDWITITISSLLLGLHFILWFDSLNYTSVVSSIVFISLQPIFTFLAAYLFLSERFSVAVVISMVITFIGSAFIISGDWQLSRLAAKGDLLAILATIAVTASFLIGHRLRRSLSLITYTFLVYSMSGIILFFYNLFSKQAFFNYDYENWLILLALAIVPTFFGHLLFNWSLKWVPATTVSMAIVFKPIVTSFLAYIILQEMVTYSQWLGGTIVIFGLFLFAVSTTRKKNVTLSIRK